MEQNIMDELDAKLGLVTLDRAEEIGENFFQEFFEEICCKNVMRRECHEHFLDNTLMYNLHEKLKTTDQNTVYGTVYFIAEMAKYETGRNYLSNVYLVCLLVDKMKREGNYYIRLETCRALSNMCYEHSNSQRLIVGQEPVETIFNLLNISCVSDNQESNDRFREVIVALILNLLSENECVLHQVADNYIPDLVKALDFDLKNNMPTPISHNLFVALVSLAEVKPPEIIFSSKTCSSLVDMFRRSPVFDYPSSGLEFLEDAELPDVTKFLFAEAGIFEVFMEALENKSEHVADEERKKYDMIGRIMANILSGDEAMVHIFKKCGSQVIARMDNWLLSRDKELVHVGALCLGNIARSDSNSIAVVEKGAHKQLINAIRQNKRDVRILYAAVSTLRNLSIPPENKHHLSNDGMVEVIIPLLDLEVRTASPIIYKGVGAVRQVIDGQESIALRLGRNLTLIRQLVNWSTASVLPWVSSECARLLCSIVNTSKDREVIINLLENGAYPQMTKLLVALHAVMQSEALAVMIVTVNAAREEARREDLNQLSEAERKKSERLSNFHNVLIECKIADKLKHLIAHHGSKMDRCILEQCLTFVEQVLRIEQIRVNLYNEGFRGVVHYVMRNREDFQQIRTRVDEIERNVLF